MLDIKAIAGSMHNSRAPKNVPINAKGRLCQIMEEVMYVISYKGGESGCPQNSIYGELLGCDWNSNNFADKRFPPEDVILDFYAQHKIVDTDFFILVVNLSVLLLCLV
ncbi:MAG: hypothetical protein ABWY25_06865 [Paenisporosarcina sp.]